MSLPPLINQTGYQSSPSCLMAGTQTLAGVAVIVLVEEEVVAPMGVRLKFFTFSETSAPAVLITRKNFDHALGNFFGHHSSRNCVSSIGRFQGKVRAERIVEPQQGMDEKVGSWKPDGASPVRVSTFQLRFGLTGLITESTFAKVKRMRLVVPRQTSDAVVREKFLRIPESLRDPVKLAGIGDRKHVALALVVTTDGITRVADKIGAIPDKPFHIRKKIRMPFQIALFQDLNRKQRN